MHGKVTIGDGAVVQDNVILGSAEDGELSIGKNCTIRSGTVIYSGVRIGDSFRSGHNVLIRENTSIGNDVLAGTNSVIDGDCAIGNNVSIQTGAYITRYTRIEDGVFLGPHSVTTNDKYMKYGATLKGPVIQTGARIGANATIMPGIVIGEGAIIGAGSVVTRDVPPGTVVMGVPARAVKDAPAKRSCAESLQRRNPMSKQLRAGVIGVGAMGKNHARLYSQLPGVELVGVADASEALAKSIARQYECQPYTNYNDLLGQDLDLVSIVVPTTLHKKAALAAIDKGINVIVEKPISDAVDNADQMIEAARHKGVKLAVGHVERFNPAVIKLKELIDDGLLGEIVSVSTRRVGPYNPRIRDVGIILDLGAHDIDIMHYLYGEKVRQVYASAGTVVHSHEDHAIITLNFPNGGSGVIDTNWLTPHKVRSLTVVGSRAIAEVNYIEQTLRIFDEQWIRDAKIEKAEPLKLELLHFIDCLRNDREPLVTGEQGRHALAVALAAIQSAESGRACQVA